MEDCRTARQVAEWRGGEADKSARGRMGLQTARKAETLRMRKCSTESGRGRGDYIFDLRKTVYSQKLIYQNKGNVDERIYPLHTEQHSGKNNNWTSVQFTSRTNIIRKDPPPHHSGG
jgi:hypothetical protein